MKFESRNVMIIRIKVNVQQMFGDRRIHTCMWLLVSYSDFLFCNDESWILWPTLYYFHYQGMQWCNGWKSVTIIINVKTVATKQFFDYFEKCSCHLVWNGKKMNVGTLFFFLYSEIQSKKYNLNWIWTSKINSHDPCWKLCIRSVDKKCSWNLVLNNMLMIWPSLA
jgi:hypothetical protein